VQLALRKYIGRFRLDELLEQKNDITDTLLEKLRSEQNRLFVEFKEAGIIAVVVPAETGR